MLTSSGMEIEFVEADPFNMTIVASKTSLDARKYNSDQVPGEIIEVRRSQIENYFKKSQDSKRH